MICFLSIIRVAFLCVSVSTAVLLLFLTSSAFAMTESRVAKEPQRLRIASTLAPLHAIAAMITGDRHEIALIGKDYSAHESHLRPSHVKALARADIVLWVGPSLEPSITRLLAQHEKVSLAMEQTEGIRILHYDASTHSQPNPADGSPASHHHGTMDVHFWLAPDNSLTFARHYTRLITQHDPGNAAFYDENLATFERTLTAQIDSIRHLLRPVQDRPYLVTHDAYRYFADFFGLKQPYTISPAAHLPPSAKQLAFLRERITEEGIGCVIAEPDYPSRTINGVIRHNPNMMILRLDPTGMADITASGDSESYADFLQRVANGFRQCLGH